MLNALRRGAKGFLAKILIGLLVLSFAVWGISDFVNQIDPTEVARAGETPVGAQEFQRLYTRTLSQTSQQLGRPITPQQAHAIGLPSQVLGQLVTDALQVDAGRALGLDIGDDQLALRIKQSPVFAAPNGEFDRFQFDRILAENRYTEADFVELERRAAIREQLVNGLLGGVVAPSPYLEAFNRFQSQTRTVDWFALSDDDLGPIEDPSQDTLRAYYEDNKARFRAPEYRGLSAVTLSAQSLADPDAVSDEAVRTAYERSTQYGTPEQRRVQQVLIDDMAVAEDAVQRLNDGTPFADILTELGRSESDVDLGLVRRGSLVDPAAADAAFSMTEPGVTAVDGRFGPLIVRVSEIVESVKPPLSEIEDQIRREIAEEEAAGQLRTMADSVEDAVAGGARVDEIAERFALPLVTVDAVSQEGNAPDGSEVDLPAKAAAISAAFAASVGDDAVPVQDGDATVWVQVDSVTEATDRPYDDVTVDVLAAWTETEKSTRLANKAEEAAEALRAGEPVATVAERLGVTAETTEPFSRSSPSEALPSPASEAAFEGPSGHVASVLTGDGRQILLKVTDVSEPAFFAESAELQGVRNTLNNGLANTILTELVNARQAEVQPTQNVQVINVITGLEQPQGGMRY
ncbi:MAG: SurA N-terminal domain-containing protein [Devosia sp.]